MARKTIDIYTITERWHGSRTYFLTPETAAAQVIQYQDKGDRDLLSLPAVIKVIKDLSLNKSKDMLNATVFKRRAV